MSIVKTFGNTDTPVTGASAPTITLPVINFNVDYRVKTDSTKEVILTNITSPLDQPETIRFGYTEVANIYSNSGLNSDQIIGSKKGINLLTQINTTLKVTDDSSGAHLGYLPISAHLVLKVPQSGYVDQGVITSVVNRLIGTLFSNGTSNVMALIKGAMTPKGL